MPDFIPGQKSTSLQRDGAWFWSKWATWTFRRMLALRATRMTTWPVSLLDNPILGCDSWILFTVVKLSLEISKLVCFVSLLVESVDLKSVSTSRCGGPGNVVIYLKASLGWKSCWVHWVGSCAVQSLIPSNVCRDGHVWYGFYVLRLAQISHVLWRWSLTT